MYKTNLYGLLSGLMAASIWGGQYVVTKVVLEVIPPFTLLTIRLVLGGLTLGAISRLRPNTKLTREQFWHSLLVGAVGYGLSLGFQFSGTKLSTAANGALITSATPAFVLLFAALILHEKITTTRVIALVISTLGVLAIVNPLTAELSPSLFQGNILLLAAGLTWALYSVLVRKVAQNIDLLVSSLAMLIGGLPSSILFGIREIHSQGIEPVTPGIMSGILFLGIISTAVAMFLWNYAFAVLPASTASLTFFAQPVIGAFLGWLFLGDQITPLFLAGGVLIGISLFIAAAETQP